MKFSPSILLVLKRKISLNIKFHKVIEFKSEKLPFSYFTCKKTEIQKSKVTCMMHLIIAELKLDSKTPVYLPAPYSVLSSEIYCYSCSFLMAQISVNYILVFLGYSNIGTTMDRSIPCTVGFSLPLSFSSSPSGDFYFVTDHLVSNT